MLTVQALTRLHISVSFDLNDGECVALQGPSGAGKSLLLRAIADLDPNDGTIKLDGMLREAVRALMLRSRVLLLDEPTSALDATSTATVEAIVAEMVSAGTGVLWSTHDGAQARRVASRLFVMASDGRIKEHPL